MFLISSSKESDKLCVSKTYQSFDKTKVFTILILPLIEIDFVFQYDNLFLIESIISLKDWPLASSLLFPMYLPTNLTMSLTHLNQEVYVGCFSTFLPIVPQFYQY